MAAPLAPTGVFSYPGDTQIQDILLLPDGGHALLLLRIGAVNLWSLLAYHWVDILAAIAVALILYVLLRLIRRPRETGKPYCRRCNYALVGVNSPSCPECGLQLRGRNRVIGRRRGPRILVLSIALGLIVANYGLGFSRISRPESSLFQWLSPWLWDWALDNGQVWLTRHQSMRCRVVEIDLDDGSITKTLFTRDGIMPGEFAVHPDGRSFFLSQGDRISQHDLDSGYELATLRAEEAGEKRFQQLSVNAAGDTVYTVTMRNTVWAWHVGDHAFEQVVHSDDPRWGRPTGVGLVPHRDCAILAHGVGSELTLCDLTTRLQIGTPVPAAPTYLSQDGGWILTCEGDGIGVWDVGTATRHHTIPVSSARIVTGPDADARFVIVPYNRPAELVIWDIENSAWVGSCTGPVSLWYHSRLSADHSLLVALAVNATAGRTRYNIVTWKLPQ